MSVNLDSNGSAEPFYPIKRASDILGIQYWKLLRAVNAGIIKSHSLLNSRRLVRLSDVVAAMECHEAGKRE